jgi:dolichol kinase
MQNNDFDFEKRRKIFHISSFIFPILYIFTSKIFIVAFLFCLTAAVIYIDIARHYNPKIRSLVNKFCGSLIRDREISGSFALSGASFMFLGFFISALLFSKGLAINCFLVLIICDSVAAIVGKKIGTIRLADHKTLEGTAGFCVSAILVSVLSYEFVGYDTSFIIITISSIIASLLECYSSKLKIDDNLMIPVAYGLSNATLSFLLT